MSVVQQHSDRFFRPSDVRATRRNHRKVQVQKILLWTANILLAAGVCLAALWAWQRTQNDVRFAVRSVEPLGAKKTSRAELDRIANRYVGTNLFRADLDALQRDFQSLPWVASVAIEKQLPGTLKVYITERQPVALLVDGNALRYVDAEARAFAPLSPEYGNPELPLVRNASRDELRRSVAFLVRVRRSEPSLYARISEVTPIAPDGFVIFDRELSAPVFVRDIDAEAKWRDLYRIAAADGIEPRAVEYVDLRFDDRIVIKPRDASVARAQ